MADKDVQITAGKQSNITVVAENKNWRDYVAKEIKAANNWNNDWGFLAGGAIEGKNTFHYFNTFVTEFRGQRTSNKNKG